MEPASCWLSCNPSYLILGHRLELRGQGVIVGVVEERPSFLQTLAHKLGLELLIALLVACKYKVTFSLGSKALL